MDNFSDKTLEQIEQEYLQTVREAEIIQSRLATKPTRLSLKKLKQYRTQRASLVAELAQKRDTQRMLKSQLHKLRKITPTAEKRLQAIPDTDMVSTLISNSWQLFKKLSKEKRVEYSDDEQSLIDTLREYLRYQGYL